MYCPNCAYLSRSLLIPIHEMPPKSAQFFELEADASDANSAATSEETRSSDDLDSSGNVKGLVATSSVESTDSSSSDRASPSPEPDPSESAQESGRGEVVQAKQFKRLRRLTMEEKLCAGAEGRECVFSKERPGEPCKVTDCDLCQWCNKQCVALRCHTAIGRNAVIQELAVFHKHGVFQHALQQLPSQHTLLAAAAVPVGCHRAI